MQSADIGSRFLEGRESVLILGDNIFFGNGLTGLLREADKVKDGAHIFSYRVQNASDYGVVTLDANDKILSIEEKPKYLNLIWRLLGYIFTMQMLQKLRKQSNLLTVVN